MPRNEAEKHKLGKAIVEAYKAKGWTQAEFCRRLDKKQSTVNSWLIEDGSTIDAPKKLQDICDRLGLDFEGQKALFDIAIEFTHERGKWKRHRAKFADYYVERFKNQTPPQTKLASNAEQTEADEKPIHFELPDLPDLKSKTCPIYFELKLGKEERIKDPSDRRERPIFEFPFLMWTERAEDWRKHFTETPAHTLLQQWSNQSGFHPIVGEPGGGKSTLLRYWANELVKMSTSDRQYLPLLVPLREVDESGIEGFFEKQGFDVEACLNNLPDGVQPVWLFDGLDELPKKHKERWTKLIKAQKQHPVLLTCRTALWDSDYRVNYGEPHYLMGMYPNEQKTFLLALADEWREGERYEHGFKDADEVWVEELHSKLQSQSSLKQLAGSPLLLTLIARTNKPNNIDLPAKRVEFYQKAFKELLKQREDDDVNAWTFIEPLSKLAYEVSKDELRAEFSESDFERFTSNLREEQIQTLKKSNILKFDDDGNCQWLHQTFQEWLIAEYLHMNGSLLSATKKFWKNPNYHEVLGLLWGLTSELVQYKTAKYLVAEGRKRCKKSKYKNYSGLRTLFSLIKHSGEQPEQLLYEFLYENTIVSFARQLAIAANDSVPGILLAELAKYDSSSIRRRVSENPNSFSETLAMLAEDDDEYIRSSVASNVNSSFVTLTKLAKDTSDYIRWNVAENVSTPYKVLAKLANDKESDYVREKVAKNPSTKSETLAKLAKDKIDSVRIKVAQNINSFPETLEKLSKDSASYVRRGVAENPNTPLETLDFLASDTDAHVRKNVARNVTCPSEILDILCKDISPSVRWCAVKVLNPFPKTLEDLLKESTFVRMSVADNINCPQDYLANLALDEDKYVRYYVSSNKNSSCGILDNLAMDSTEYVRWGTASNMNTSVKTLDKLADDERVYVRRKVAENGNCSRITLDQLSQDKIFYVRGNVAANANSSPVTLFELATDSVEYVRRRVATNINTTPETLAQLAHDEDIDVRRNVAANPNTSVETLAELLGDDKGTVWSNVIGNPTICLEWF